MNYDPRLGRFLQADSEIEPDATQGLNRYTYVLNNPLSASDPTGHRSEWVDAAKGIAAIAVSVFLPQTGWIFAKETFGAYVFAGFIGGSISGGLQGGLWGAFSASVFYGIGNSFTPYQKAARGIKQLADVATLAKIVSHGMAGGAINLMRGGKFGHGFVSASITEASSPALEHFSDFGQVVGGALVGGTVSTLTGGKFGNGAMTGAFQMAIDKTDPFRRLTRIKGGKVSAKIIGLDGPGYRSADEASLAAFKEYDYEYMHTVTNELSGLVIEWRGGFYFTEAVLGGLNSSHEQLTPNSPPDAYLVGTYHTHPGPNGEEFSALDLGSIDSLQATGYIRTPSGYIGAIDPEVMAASGMSGRPVCPGGVASCFPKHPLYREGEW